MKFKKNCFRMDDHTDPAVEDCRSYTKSTEKHPRKCPTNLLDL